MGLPADTAGFGIPAYVIANFEFLCHDKLPAVPPMKSESGFLNTRDDTESGDTSGIS
jgi:hypothetical protein